MSYFSLIVRFVLKHDIVRIRQQHHRAKRDARTDSHGPILFHTALHIYVTIKITIHCSSKYYMPGVGNLYVNVILQMVLENVVLCG